MLKPLHSLVLCVRDQQPKSVGLIQLPEDQIEQSLWVTILAVGPGQVNRNGSRYKLNAVVGKKMLLRQWAGLRIEPEKGWESPLLVPDERLEAFYE